MAEAPIPAPGAGGNISFFFAMIDGLTAEDWRPEAENLPSLPRETLFTTFASFYHQLLASILDSKLNKEGWVQKIYAHFGSGGLFEFNPTVFKMSSLEEYFLKDGLLSFKEDDPNSKAFTQLNYEEPMTMFANQRNFQRALERLLRYRHLVKPSSHETIAREIVTDEEVNSLYKRIHEDYVKIGCLAGIHANDAHPPLGKVLKEHFLTWNTNKQLMFLFGNDAVDFMERKLLVNNWVRVSEDNCDYEVSVELVLEKLESKSKVLERYLRGYIEIK